MAVFRKLDVRGSAVLVQLAGLLATAVLVAINLTGASQPGYYPLLYLAAPLLTPVCVLLAALYKERRERGAAARSAAAGAAGVIDRLRDSVRRLLGAAHADSIFRITSGDVGVTAGENTDCERRLGELWTTYNQEKAGWLQRRLDGDIAALQRTDPAAAFFTVCQLMRELGAHLAACRVFLERGGRFSPQVREWYNARPRAAFDATALDLRRAAADLAAYEIADSQAKRQLLAAAQEIYDQRPLPA